MRLLCFINSKGHCSLKFNFFSTSTHSLFLQSSFPADQHAGYTSAWGYLPPGAGLGISLFCTSLSYCLLFFQVVNIILKDSTAIWNINQSLCKLARDAHCPIIQVTNKGIRLCWPSFQPLEHSASNCPPPEFQATDHNALSTAVQAIFKPLHHTLI